jgi:hypothetical protein
VFGNLLAVTVAYGEGGADLVVTVANDTGITLTLGTTGGVPNLSWDQVATAFNADPAGALAVMVGETNSGIPQSSEIDDGGSAGLGLGQFYAAGTVVPPAPCVSVMSMVTLLANPTPSYAGQATPETEAPVISQL